MSELLDQTSRALRARARASTSAAPSARWSCPRRPTDVERRAPARGRAAVCAEARRDGSDRPHDARVLAALASASRGSMLTSRASPSSRPPVGQRLGLADAELEELSAPRSCTTSARSPCPTRSCKAPARSTSSEWVFIRQHRSSASASSPPRRRCAIAPHRSLDPRALGRRGIPRRARRQGDPLRVADHPRLRRVRGNDPESPPAGPHGGEALGAAAGPTPRSRVRSGRGRRRRGVHPPQVDSRWPP